MSVASTTRKQQFSLDGVTAAFTFTFRALTSNLSDIKCTVTTAGVDTNLTYTTDFTVAVNASGVGGTVTLVVPASWSGTLTVYRDTTNLQSSDYDDYNQFPANTLETDLDIRTLVSQEQEEDLVRSLRFPITTNADGELPNPTSKAGYAVVVNDTEDGLDFVALSGQSAPVDGGTMAGVLNLGEGADGGTIGLELDAALSADGKYSGITEAGTAGATIAFGEVCTLHTDSKWYLADANTAAASSGDSRRKIGICVKASTNGNSTKLLVWGKVRADAKFPTLTIGAAVYVSETAGAIVVTQPSTADVVIRVIGFANTADELFFCPSPDYITHL